MSKHKAIILACIVLFTILIGIIIFFITNQNGNQKILLFEDFNDGSYSNENPTRWQIDWSNSRNPTGDPSKRNQDPPEVICIQDNCYLEGHTSLDPEFSQNVAFIYTDNVTDVGSWKFESQLQSTESNIYNSLIIGTDSSPFNGDYYSISHIGDGRIVFTKNINGQSIELLKEDNLYNKDGLWHTIELTRNSSGEWNVFFDSKLVGTVNDNSITSFSILLVGRYGNVDNVTVSSD